MTQEEFNQLKGLIKKLPIQHIRYLSTETINILLLACKDGMMENHTSSYTLEWLKEQPDWEDIKTVCADILYKRLTDEIFDILK